MGFLYDRTADVLRLIYDRRIDGPPVLDIATHFPAGAAFLASWRAIRDEAMALAATRLLTIPRFHEVMREQASISANDNRDWRMFVLKAYGIEVEGNRAACPTMAAIADAHPEVLSASFSFLAPGKYVPPHRGPFRGILRFYLVLSMPLADDGTPLAVLRIADKEYRLNDGEALLWDDTYEHEVRNQSDQLRVVMLLDVWRPNQPIDMAIFSRLCIGIGQAGIRLRGMP